ncbi:MAG: hypothetical protein IPG67_10520 [Acidobacteria bacterium]|nr:hypothetical protein [Acidobacteriota bacterium]MBK7932545.1 hypothetical protein [Acidobacteriota bacterium]
MKATSILTSVILVLVISSVGFSQQPTPEIHIAPNAPKDKPIDVVRGETQKFDEAIKPHIETAKRTYPQAKERFLKGLPPKHSFFITTRLRDPKGRFEQVFVAVKDIANGKVKGVIASDIQLVEGFKFGDPYTFQEGELIDWTISKPDGSEDGNFVGKFLDAYQAGHVIDAPIWRDQPATPERMSQRIEEAAIRYQANAPIPRVILYDIGYPRDEKEYSALDGNAVILITAVAQDKLELPLKRVYVTIDGKEIELKQIKLVLSESPSNKSASAKTFGAFRADALYILPIKLRMAIGDLNADFAANKTGFKMAAFGTPVSDDVGQIIAKGIRGPGLNEPALDKFIKREFPSFFN